LDVVTELSERSVDGSLQYKAVHPGGLYHHTGFLSDQPMVHPHQVESSQQVVTTVESHERDKSRDGVGRRSQRGEEALVSDIDRITDVLRVHVSHRVTCTDIRNSTHQIDTNHQSHKLIQAILTPEPVHDIGNHIAGNLTLTDVWTSIASDSLECEYRVATFTF